MSVITRFASNVVLSRLLNPEIFGMMLIINTVRQGVELSSDLGFAQNVIQNKAGDRPAFFNTVWIMQMLRGCLLGAIMFFGANFVSQLYSVPASALELSAATLFMAGMTSTSIYLLHRNLQLAKLNLFELVQDILGAALAIIAALLSPTVVSLVLAMLVAQSIRALSSYALTMYRNRFQFDRGHAIEILKFGRWIFLSSILMFLCASFDRLYLGKVASLSALGIYGIARALSDVPTLLAARIGYSVIFPLVSSTQSDPRSDVRARLSGIRFKLLLIAAAAVAFGVSIADIAIAVIYDARYHDAQWMLTLLLIGVWPAVLCALAEYMLLGFGKPIYGVAGNGLKLLFYLIVLPLAHSYFGMLGAIVAIASSELARYLGLGIGQWREQLSFFRQDGFATLIFLTLVVAISWLRWLAGLGTAFDSIPIDMMGWPGAAP